VDYYREACRLREIDGDRDVEEVTAEMFRAIDQDSL
jgi:hypothetical protein